jgi:hypothetical protein
VPAAGGIVPRHGQQTPAGLREIDCQIKPLRKSLRELQCPIPSPESRETKGGVLINGVMHGAGYPEFRLVGLNFATEQKILARLN